MTIEKGLLDEVFGVFIGASFTLTFFNTSLSVPARIGPLIFGLVIIPGLLLTLKFEKGWIRFGNYLVWFVVSIALTFVLVFLLKSDAVTSFSLPIGIIFWAVTRELVDVIERSA